MDANKRPELLDKVNHGELHELTCPLCKFAGRVDAPLLVYRPGASPALIFSPARQTTQQQNQEQANSFLRYLRNQLGDGWRNKWVEQMLVVPRAVLPTYLTGSPEAAAREMEEQAAGELERLRRIDPEAYQKLEEEVRRRAEIESLLRRLQEFVQAKTWVESERIVEQNSELLSDEMDVLLVQWIFGARQEQDENVVHMLEEHRRLLRHCWEIGIRAAFQESGVCGCRLLR